MSSHDAQDLEVDCDSHRIRSGKRSSLEPQFLLIALLDWT